MAGTGDCRCDVAIPPRVVRHFIPELTHIPSSLKRGPPVLFESVSKRPHAILTVARLFGRLIAGVADPGEPGLPPERINRAGTKPSTVDAEFA